MSEIGKPGSNVRPHRVGRREWLKSATSITLLNGLAGCWRAGAAVDVEFELAALERESGGRLGVAVGDLGSGELSGLRLDERFGMCSTFKLPLAAIVLRLADEGEIALDERVPFSPDDMVPYAPVTEPALEQGFMEVADLAEAAQTTSDNVAANLLLKRIGGPAGFTRELRRMGDETTRLDRFEPGLNFVPAGESRDTSTPRAFADTVRQFVAGPLLTAQSRRRLRGWLEGTTTGLKRLRAGFPDTWRAGDKTGTAYAEGMANKYNDVAVVWPDGGAPGLVVAAFYEADGAYDSMRDRDVAVLAAVGRIVAGAVV